MRLPYDVQHPARSEPLHEPATPPSEEAGEGRLRRLAPDAVALFGFVLLAVYATWPLARYAASRVPSNLADPLENVWIFSWAAHALAHDPLGVFHANMFFPERFTLAYAENMVGLSALVAPLYWVTGNGVLVVNVAILAVFATSGFGTYLLARELGAPRTAGFLAGAAYALSPWRVDQLAHPHIVAVHLLPFVLLVLVRLGRRPTRRLVVALALLLALQFWSSLYGGLLALCAVGVWAAWIVACRRRAALPTLARAGVGVGLSLVLVIPVAAAYVEARRLHPEYNHPLVEHYAGSATPRSYLDPVPRGTRPVASSYRWLDRRFENRPPSSEKELFPGWWVLSGAGAAAAGAGWSLVRLRSRRRRHVPERPWLAPAGLVALVGLTGFVLSLGPRWGARPDGLRLPYGVVFALTPGGLMRVPSRFGTLVFLALALALALGLARVRPSRRRWLAAGLGVAMVLELMPWVAMIEPPPITAAHRAVAGRPGAVLALPTTEFRPGGEVFGITQREPLQLYFSTAHFRPLVNGYGAFVPSSYYELVRAVQDFPTPSSLQALRDRDVRTVVVDTRLMDDSRWADAASRLDAWPGVRLLAEAGGVRAYDVSGARIQPDQ